MLNAIRTAIVKYQHVEEQLIYRYLRTFPKKENYNVSFKVSNNTARRLLRKRSVVEHVKRQLASGQRATDSVNNNVKCRACLNPSNMHARYLFFILDEFRCNLTP